MFAIHAVHTHHDVRNETGTHNWGQNTTVSNLSGNCVLILSPVSYADFSHIRQNRLPGSVVDLQPFFDPINTISQAVISAMGINNITIL